MKRVWVTHVAATGMYDLPAFSNTGLSNNQSSELCRLLGNEGLIQQSDMMRQARAARDEGLHCVHPSGLTKN
ncbi:MAG: hypothetical protein JW943_07640 [Deltaproteobacteria bacterium]|nr:hypothetical protein [Deltaproteobacteria bacterium]